jgi:glycerophosphoryl diester phosphodiesterase
VKPRRLAHRGDWRRAPENSLAAMRAALAVPGCDGLEFDVRESADGVPVLLHDATLERVQKVPAACVDLTADELATHGVPTLAEILAAVGKEPFLDVEVKGPPIPALLDVLGAARGDGSDGGQLYRAAVSSFETRTLAWLGDRRPQWPRWLNARDLAPATVSQATELGCAGIAALWSSIDEAGLAGAGAADLEVIAWTVRRRGSYRRLARLGVSAICVEAAALDG